MPAARAPSTEAADAPRELTLVTQRALARAELDDVRTLHLWTGKIRDLSPLRRAKQLSKIVLYQTSVTDLSPLVGLESLVDLQLYENPELADLGPIAGLSALEALEIEAPRAVRLLHGRLRAIGALRRLRRLSVWSAPRARLEWLGSLAGLRDLVVRGCRVRATWLAGLDLRTLDLQRCGTTDLGELAGMRRLRALSLAANGLTEVRALDALAGLRFLSVSHNRLTDLRPLAGLPKLTRLDADFNQIASLPRDLGAWARLESLNLRHNRLTDVAPLAALRRLSTLRLDENRVGSVAPLRGLRRLAYLYLRENRVRDLAPLAALRALVVLEVAGNPAPVDGLFALPKLVRVDSTFAKDAAAGAAGARP